MDRTSYEIAKERTVTTVVAAFLVLFITCHDASAQTGNKAGKYSSYLHDKIELTDLDDRLITGWFLCVEGDSIYLWIDSKDTAVALSDLKVVEVWNGHEQGKYAIVGGIIGGMIPIVLNYKFSHPHTAPNQWNNYLTAATTTTLISAAGAAIGYLFDQAEDLRTKKFVLYDLDQIELMRDELMSSFLPFRMNLYLQTAHVFTSFDNNITYSTLEADNTRSLNYARSISLTAGISSHMEVGFSIRDVSEPNLSFTYKEGQVSERAGVSNTVTGYYLTGSYDLLPAGGRKRFSLSPALGFGFATIDYRGNLVGRELLSVVTIEKTELSLFFALEFRYHPVKDISIALIGDFIFIPRTTPESGIKYETGRHFSNSSIGLSFGYHF